MKREEIELLLPEVIQRAIRPGGPAFALLEVMESLHQPAEDALERLDAIFDSRRTPPGFVPYMARWVDLSRILPVTTGVDCLRELIAAAAELCQWRGTSRGLILFLETATGVAGFGIDEQLTRSDGRPRPFHVRVRAPQSTAPHRALIERIIDAEKPAYVTYDLDFEPAEGA